MPNQVQRLSKAQQLHDRKHYDERMNASPEERAKMEYIDYLRPIVADADTGLVSYHRYNDHPEHLVGTVACQRL